MDRRELSSALLVEDMKGEVITKPKITTAMRRRNAYFRKEECMVNIIIFWGRSLKVSSFADFGVCDDIQD